MILKDRDGAFADIERLSRLAAHPNASPRQRIEIEEEIRRLKAGERGESSAAYHLKTFFGASENWIVIHDLRLEHDGVVAQIDHLLIGRLLDIWVCESKNVANGVKINEHGEFVTFYDRKPRAMASPVEQTERHIHVLQRVLDSGKVQLPTRLGMTLRPRLRGLVLIANGSISRPRVAVPGLEMVIKSEHLRRHVTRAGDSGNPLDLAKYISFETLKALGDQLVAMHRPIVFDWERRIGLQVEAASASRSPHWQSPEAYLGAQPVPQRNAVQGKQAERPAASPVAQTSKQTGGCEKCGAVLTSGVRAFCERNPERFNGGVYCMACQPSIGRSIGRP